MFLERLIEFLAFLVQKLGQKSAYWQGAFPNTFWGFPKLILSFFGPNLGTRNAKNPFGPFKVPNSNQKVAKLKKTFYVILMAPAGLKGRSGKNAGKEISRAIWFLLKAVPCEYHATKFFSRVTPENLPVTHDILFTTATFSSLG